MGIALKNVFSLSSPSRVAAEILRRFVSTGWRPWLHSFAATRLLQEP
jgi:hypothetical protein